MYNPDLSPLSILKFYLSFHEKRSEEYAEARPFYIEQYEASQEKVKEFETAIRCLNVYEHLMNIPLR